MVSSAPVGRQRGYMVSAWSIIAFLSLLGLPLCHGEQPEERCDARAGFQRVNSMLKRKQYGEARAVLRQLQTCHNLAAVDMFNVGWLYGKARDFPSALTIFRAVNADVPDHPTHEYAIALSEFELGDYKSTVKVLTALRSKGLCAAKCSDLLGVAYSKLGLYQDAYPVLAENLQKNPTDLFAYLNLVTFFADTGNFATAAEIASRIDSAVAKAVGEAESRQVEKTRQLVTELEDTRRRLLVAAAEYDMSQRRAGAIRETAYVMPPADRGEPK